MFSWALEGRSIGAEQMDFLATRLVPELIPFSLEIAREACITDSMPLSIVRFLHSIHPLG